MLNLKVLITCCLVMLCACPYTGENGVCPGGFCVSPHEAADDDSGMTEIPVDNGNDSGVEVVDAGTDQDSEDENSNDDGSSDDGSSDDGSSDSCCKHPGQKGPHPGKHKCKHGNGRSWRHRCWR